MIKRLRLWITDRLRNCKWAYQRATRGYADCDVWNFDHWFCKTISAMLYQLSDTCCGYPGTEEFPTLESFQVWLKHIAHDIRFNTEEEQEKLNPYNPLSDEEFEDYYARCEMLAQEAQYYFEEAMSQFAKNFHSLWD